MTIPSPKYFFLLFSKKLFLFLFNFMRYKLSSYLSSSSFHIFIVMLMNLMDLSKIHLKLEPISNKNTTKILISFFIEIKLIKNH